MPRYEIRFAATVNASNDAAAAKAVQELKKHLANPLLVTLLRSSGIDIQSYSVEPRPRKV